MKNLLLLALVSTMLTLVGCGGSGPGDRVIEFNHAMADGDVETVKEIAPFLSTMLSDDKLTEMIESAAKDAEDKGGIESVTIDEETITGETARVKATVTFGNGETETDEVDLKKVDGEWILVLDTEEKEDGPELEFDADPETPEVPELPESPETP